VQSGPVQFSLSAADTAERVVGAPRGTLGVDDYLPAELGRTAQGRRRAALGGFDGDGWEAGAGQSGRVNPRAGVRYRVASSIGGPPPDLPRTRLGVRGAVS
jgi:hypothetical protein